MPPVQSRWVAETPPRFSRSWSRWLDECIPTTVKERYSPDPKWASKPFSEKDRLFYTKGITELSDAFTSERSQPWLGRPYFQIPKNRSSYLLYFLPLQAAKFLTVFQSQPTALENFLKPSTHPKRVLDLGAGPGTASFALMFELLAQRRNADFFPHLHLVWVDQNRQILEDGRALFQKLSELEPILKEKVKLELISCPWEEYRPDPAYDLILVGNLLNEFKETEISSQRKFQKLADLIGRSRDAGTLFLEPALRSSSQTLSALRDRLFEEQVLRKEPGVIWGPCLHVQGCPLSRGKDWCHFSVKAVLPGVWFEKFSKSLGSKREWLKYSYLWVASQERPAPPTSPLQYRAVSDPIHERDGGKSVLLCAPNQVERIPAPASLRATRGAFYYSGKKDRG